MAPKLSELEKFQSNTLTFIYQNLGIESRNIAKNCGSNNPVEIKDIMQNGELLGSDLCEVKIDLHLIALQLKLLDDIKMPIKYRDKNIETELKILTKHLGC